ncbi:MAG: hypothetical protein FWE42_04505, partial [Defluviitaleaceae bacterium]|nr:hypothetical protein [Defluviitaleaceae bacterium]
MNPHLPARFLFSQNMLLAFLLLYKEAIIPIPNKNMTNPKKTSRITAVIKMYKIKASDVKEIREAMSK